MNTRTVGAWKVDGKYIRKSSDDDNSYGRHNVFDTVRHAFLQYYNEQDVHLKKRILLNDRQNYFHKKYKLFNGKTSYDESLDCKSERKKLNAIE